MEIHKLIENWKERQVAYEKFAEKYRNVNQRNYEKFTYKAMATRDCWKELSKLHQHTVISSVCNSPCCKEQGVHEVPLGSEWYCEECYKQTSGS